MDLPFKFLSNADLVLQLGLLKRELFIAIWIAVALCIAIYLYGGLRFPHDSKLERMSVGRWSLGTVFLVLAIYMMPGMWGAPLNLISGFPPPMFYAEAAGSVASTGDMVQETGTRAMSKRGSAITTKASPRPRPKGSP